jgi:hypothetical protein
MKEFHITDMKTGEKLSNFTELGEGDLVIGNQAYGTLPEIEYLMGKGSGYVLRLRENAFSVYEEGGGKVEILERFRGLEEGESRSIAVYGKIEGELVPLRLCGLRKDGDSERKGLKRLKKENQRKQQGKEVSEKQEEWNKYIIVATSLGAEVSASSVLELYRAWRQIELVFKRLKSLFGYNGVPMKEEGTLYSWFYGKLLLAALCELVVAEGRSMLSGGGAGDGQQAAGYERLNLWKGTVYSAGSGNGIAAGNVSRGESK